jgi:hypothetical protein
MHPIKFGSESRPGKALLSRVYVLHRVSARGCKMLENNTELDVRRILTFVFAFASGFSAVCAAVCPAIL